MTITATCPKCRLARTIEIEGDFDAELADVLTRFASHAPCDACADQRAAPMGVEPKAQKTARLPYADN